MMYTTEVIQRKLTALSTRTYYKILHKCINIPINALIFYILPIMLVLCLKLSMTHYAQNYVCIYNRQMARSLDKIYTLHLPAMANP